VEAASTSATGLKVEKITSSRGPEQQQQRRQRVYRHQGVQKALVLFQINQKHSRLKTSLLKNIIL
jgi:hypothetical protein